jgi:uncharacterized membrane-anchored protein
MKMSNKLLLGAGIVLMILMFTGIVLSRTSVDTILQSKTSVSVSVTGDNQYTYQEQII